MASAPATGAHQPAPQSAAACVADRHHDGKRHLLLAACGSVATIKLPLILSSLSALPDLSIRVVLTRNAAHFLAGQSPEQPDASTLALLPNVDSVHLDEGDREKQWRGDSDVLHIELGRWAHLLAIVPMSANVLSKIANGLCDDLLTRIVRAWDTHPDRRKRIIVAPSMNTCMWKNPVTTKQISLLEKNWGVDDGKGSTSGWIEVLPPQEKTLACGDTGQGGMCDWEDIVSTIRDRLPSSALDSSNKEPASRQQAVE